MARRIVITSGKGGVGKTTIVSSLGVVLARRGYNVLLVDMDFGLNNLDVLMGIENKIVYDIIDVLEGKCSARQAVVQDFYEHNLYIFPSSHSYCKVKFGAKELLSIIAQVESGFDFVLIDCPAGMDGGFRRAVECAQEVLVVTTPHLSAVRDADKIINAIVNFLHIRPYIVVNRARGDLILDGEMLSISTICDYLNGELIGVVSEDDDVSIQLYNGERLKQGSELSVTIDMIASNLINDDNEIYDCTKKYKGLFGRIRKKIKRRV